MDAYPLSGPNLISRSGEGFDVLSRKLKMKVGKVFIRIVFNDTPLADVHLGLDERIVDYLQVVEGESQVGILLIRVHVNNFFFLFVVQISDIPFT